MSKLSAKELIEKIAELPHEHTNKQLDELLKKYHETANELCQHTTEKKSTKQLHHLLHELEANVIHNDHQKSDFLTHHAEAIKQANEEWFRQRHDLALEEEAYLFEMALEEEIETLLRQQHRIKHILEEYARLEYALEKKKKAEQDIQSSYNNHHE